VGLIDGDSDSGVFPWAGGMCQAGLLLLGGGKDEKIWGD
jgi:hypothetical protein